LGLADGNRLTWSSVSDNAYQIEAATDLESGFTAISGPIIATGTTASYLDTAATDSHRFYRVKLVPE
jgi:hypothetical protein